MLSYYFMWQKVEYFEKSLIGQRLKYIRICRGIIWFQEEKWKKMEKKTPHGVFCLWVRIILWGAEDVNILYCDLVKICYRIVKWTEKYIFLNNILYPLYTVQFKKHFHINELIWFLQQPYCVGRASIRISSSLTKIP